MDKYAQEWVTLLATQQAALIHKMANEMAVDILAKAKELAEEKLREENKEPKA